MLKIEFFVQLVLSLFCFVCCQFSFPTNVYLQNPSNQVFYSIPPNYPTQFSQRYHENPSHQQPQVHNQANTQRTFYSSPYQQENYQHNNFIPQSINSFSPYNSQNYRSFQQLSFPENNYNSLVPQAQNLRRDDIVDRTLPARSVNKKISQQRKNEAIWVFLFIKTIYNHQSVKSILNKPRMLCKWLRFQSMRTFKKYLKTTVTCQLV